MKRDKLSEILQQKTVNPSENSWEKLQQQLDSAQSKKPKVYQRFLKYAAAILVFLSIGYFVFQPEELNWSQEKMEEPIQEDTKTEVPVEVKEPKTELAEQETTIQKESVEESNKKETKIETKKNYLAKRNTEVSTKVVDLEDDKVIVDNLQHAEIQHINKEIIPMNQSKPIPDIDAEVALLLEQATIKTQEENKKTAVTINADDLLFEVEEELDKDLKEILFDKIKKSLNNPKQVVTEAEY